MKRRFGYLFLMFLLLFGLYQIPQASNERNWTSDQKIMTTVRIVDDEIQLRNIRNFTYQSETEYERNYYDKTLKVEDVVSVDFILSHFADWQGAAHAFLSFGFQGKDDIEYVAVSVEIRKEEGEEYSPFWGLFKRYELSYVVADERDVIRLRTNFREEPLYIFPIQTSKENIEAF